MRTSTLAAAVLATLVGSAGAQTPTPRALDLEDYYRIESASDPQISPDGRVVAFVRSVIIEADNARQTEIWVAPTDGTTPPTRLTTPAFNATSPRWSPDGTLLAFSSRRPIPGAPARTAAIWFLHMDRAGGEAFQIPGVDALPVFSPDNQWIAFTREVPPAPRAAPPPSDFERTLADRFKGRIVDWMNYRFDGRGYLPDPRDPQASPPRELFVVSRAGGTARQLTSLGVDVQDPAWRPDSQALAFTADAHQRDEYVYERADVWTIDLAPGSTPNRLTDDGFDHDSVAWAPDGRTLYVRRQMGLDQVIASKQQHGAPVDVVSLAVPSAGAARAAAPTNLTADWDLLPGPPLSGADGRTVFFSAGITGNQHLFRVPAAGGVVRQITRGDRQLERFSASRDFSRWAYLAGDVTHPAEVYTAAADVTDEKPLSALNASLLADRRLQAAERVLGRSADGTEIEGWLLAPRGADRATRWPMILAIHGGPHGAYGNAFSFQFQLWAARGYAVLYANPRGSTGYGERFLWGTWGGWGNRDFEDVMAVVDAAVARYPIDERRLGVTGYSYGGFLANWVITHTRRFAAAVVGAGISNWISDYGTADIPRTKESEFNGPPWEDASRDLLLRQSPVIYAKNVSTPTLFVHGEADLRVPIEQAEQMYVALKKRRVPARFIRYPDMYHGGWTPWNTVHRYHHELAWWSSYLTARPNSNQ